MRRRWLLILGGLVVLGVITIFALALLVPRAPFRFLDGHEPSLDIHIATPHRSKRMAYSFKAEWKVISPRIESELLRLGYKNFHGSEHDSIDPWGRESGGPDSGWNWVWVMRDTRSDRASGYTDAKGWIYVEMSLASDPTLWDRIKAVFGL